MAQRQSELRQGLQGVRKRHLIDATLTAISIHGISAVTLSKIAALAGMTAGNVNFHFASKEALLLDTLRTLAGEFETAIQTALTGPATDPARQLLAVVDANLDPVLSDPRKIAVWYAFMSESSARSEYQQICGERDGHYYAILQRLCSAVINAGGKTEQMHSRALASALAGLLDGIWQDILFHGEGFDRDSARRQCVDFLGSVFPWCFGQPGADGQMPVTEPGVVAALTQDGLNYTLPSWVYNNEEFFRLEREHVFLPSWQLVCHVHDIPKPGDYVTYTLYNERAFVIRDRDGSIHGWNNVCPHRAHTLLQDNGGRCGTRLTCPYHGWTFSLAGKRIGLSAPDTFSEHDRERFGLKPVETGVYHGFIFIRFRPGGPAIAETFKPLSDEFSRYNTETMVAAEPREGGNTGWWMEEVAVDWKNGLENYVEDYHFPAGHRGLSALMQEDYEREPHAGGVCRLSHEMRQQPLKNWSAELYHRYLPDFTHLPQHLRRRWNYHVMYPNTFFDIFPEQMDFMQMIPLAPGRMLLRGRTYHQPDDSRTGRLVRYLGDRINRRVQDEDNLLTEEVQKGLATSAYGQGILSDKEILVKHFQDWIRERLPVARLAQAPEKGNVSRLNTEPGRS